ncbi:MAG TPA: TetR/AcrR family transcriptional regulator [Anaerolineales bacterium]|nr:TetR/AcrR family transcriptional regulator [Anaerolineales bacterium]HMV98369.1 TetR/AcrR family transcriptional regulator [Anaerolineales bacterium]HMX19023.1 TetR/AcrR family transcriptional regulator [Anaerolineales bacterium]HMX76486.1 TetR/AcrR family transcriptional regulator [Anaerolineales bacterium]HMZ44080.1 TetR/AcrR family transcriptional regulator [Anaerolineales bacterium]
MPKKKTYHHGDLKNALIKAGVEILAKDGVSGLSLRKVALKAGVSHAAPYAHFADKQALIAAISTEGFRQLYERVSGVAEKYQSQPEKQLTEAAWAYVQFAMDDRDRFKVMFSGVLEKEKEYSDFVVESQRNFQLVKSIVEANQASGRLRGGDSALVALSAWGIIHGFLMLLLEGQISHAVLEKMSLRELVEFQLEQIKVK